MALDAGEAQHIGLKIFTLWQKVTGAIRLGWDGQRLVGSFVGRNPLRWRSGLGGLQYQVRGAHGCCRSTDPSQQHPDHTFAISLSTCPFARKRLLIGSSFSLKIRHGSRELNVGLRQW